jgi:uncharacterized membrane protein (TIGR02234 family)
VTRLRPSGKPVVVLLAVAGAAALLASGGRPWVTGTVDDAVLGASRVSGSGRDVASGVVALALVGIAAALASTTSGAVVRRVSLALVVVAGLAEAFVAGRVLADPDGALGTVAARATGRTGSIETHASATAWPWVAVVAGAVLVLAGGLGWWGARRWQGLGARYEVPEAQGARGQRVASDWDRLDAGEDPTLPDGRSST